MSIYFFHFQMNRIYRIYNTGFSYLNNIYVLVIGNEEDTLYLSKTFTILEYMYTEPLRMSTERLSMYTGPLRMSTERLSIYTGPLRMSTERLSMYTGPLRMSTERLSMYTEPLRKNFHIIRKREAFPSKKMKDIE